MTRVLFLGDVVGRAGRDAIRQHLGAIRAAERVDLVIVNAENAAGGSGLTREIALDLRNSGVDGITLGDHVWDQRGFERDIEELPFVCRPFNLPDGCPGARHLIVQGGDLRLGVVTALGDQLIKVSSDPAFPRIGPYIEAMASDCDAVLVEMHAETTSEKMAMGWYLDGRVAAVVGTHTHIPTADHRRLPRGTGFICDVGMCGPYDSILGREIAPILGKFIDGMPRKFTVAEANVQLCGALIDIEPGKRGCVDFRPYRFIVDASG